MNMKRASTDGVDPEAACNANADPPKKTFFDDFQSDVVKLASEGLVRDVAVQRKLNTKLEKEIKELKETNRKLVSGNGHLKQ